MIRIILFLCIGLLWSLPVMAQDRAQEELGAGPKGRYSEQQALEIALRAVPGAVLSTDGWWENDRFFLGFKILRADNSIFEVEVNTLSGKVQNIEVEYLAEGATFPGRLIAQSVADLAALSHIQGETTGRAKAKILSSYIVVHERKPAYRVEVKKSARVYGVLVDAVSGKIISAKKQD